MKLVFGRNSFSVTRISFQDYPLLDKIPLLKASFRFNKQNKQDTSCLEIGFTDDIISNDEAKMIIASLVTLYLDFPEVVGDREPWLKDAGEAKKFFNFLDDWDIDTFNTANIFLGFKQYEIHPVWVEILLEKKELQKLPYSEKLYPLYLQTLQPATKEELPFKEILERENAGDFGFEYLSKKRIIRTKEHIQRIKKYKPWMLSQPLVKWEFSLKKHNVMISDEKYYLFETDTTEPAPYYTLECGEDNSNLHSLSEMHLSKIEHEVLDLFKLVLFSGVYIGGPMIRSLLSDSWGFKYKSVTILITKNYTETLEKVLQSSYVQEKFKSSYTMFKIKDDCIIIGRPELEITIPRKGHTLESWFSESIDSECVALTANEKGKIDFIYSRRFEHSMLYCCNVLQAKFNKEHHVKSYDSSRKECCFPLFPAGINLFNNYLAGLQINPHKRTEQIKETVNALIFEHYRFEDFNNIERYKFIKLKETDQASDIMSHPQVIELLNKQETTKITSKFDYFAPIPVNLDEEDESIVIEEDEVEEEEDEDFIPTVGVRVTMTNETNEDEDETNEDEDETNEDEDETNGDDEE